MMVIFKPNKQCVLIDAQLSPAGSRKLSALFDAVVALRRIKPQTEELKAISDFVNRQAGAVIDHERYGKPQSPLFHALDV